MNLSDLKPSFLSLSLTEQHTLLEDIRESRFRVKERVKRVTSKKSRKKKKEPDLQSLSTEELEVLITQLQKDQEELDAKLKGRIDSLG